MTAPELFDSDQDFAERALRISEPFRQWPADVLHGLARQSNVLEFPHGAVVLSRGQIVRAIYVIGSGGVETHVGGSDGRQFIFRYSEPGRTFGLLSFVDGGKLPHESVAVETTRMVAIPFSAMEEAMTLDSRLWIAVARELAGRFRRQIALTEESTFEPARVRLARELLNLSESHGEAGPTGTVLRLRLTQARMGELIGVSRQTVTTHLRELIGSGLVKWRYGNVTLCNIPALKKIAASGIV